MKRKCELPELLAPAGDFEALVAAVSAGADAVYIGGKCFSARAFAKNFEIDEIRRAAVYCRLHGVRLYVTLNTLIFDKELRAALEYAAELYSAGVDALITADIGLIGLIRKHIPDFEIHASTQMSVHNSYGADEAAALGCSRVVLARELSGADIAAVTERCAAETEVFLHGALCVCHSGQCLFSSLVGGRSGNRGECAQPCRLPYNGGKYPLSLRDLSLASHIPELIASGTASLKIEGRMKSADYVYRVTKIYRRLLDEGRCATSSELSELERIFSRGGFTDGYFDGSLDFGMTGVRSSADKDSTRALGTSEFPPERIKITAIAAVKADMPAELTLTLGKRTVTARGATPAAAISSPITEEKIKACISKMGNTFFSLDADDIEIELDGGLNLSPAAINELRRAAVKMLEGTEREPIAIEAYAPKRRKQGALMRTAQFLNAAVAKDFYKRFSGAAKYFDIAFLPLFDISESLEIPAEKLGVSLPPIIMENEVKAVKAKLEEAKKLGVLYTLVSNLSHFALIDGLGLRAVCDFRMNISNSESANFYQSRGALSMLSSAELTLPQVRDTGCGTVVYGRIPLMITERCFIKENFGCEHCGKASLRDRKNISFPMIKEWRHRNIILNSAITYMADKERELADMRITQRHFLFTTENAAECAETVSAYKEKKPPRGGVAIRRIGAASPSKDK